MWRCGDVEMWRCGDVELPLIYRRVLCSGEFNIRVDLLLFYPVLLGATLWVPIAAARAALRRRLARKETA
jgi:hypothetical protein